MDSQLVRDGWTKNRIGMDYKKWLGMDNKVEMMNCIK